MRRLFAAVATAAMTAGMVTALSLPAGAADATEALPELSAGQLDALRRDLGLTPDEARRRAAAVAPAAATQAALRARLGARFGGAWMAEDGVTLVVGVTDPAAAAEVRSAGARPAVVARDLAELDRTKAALDAAAARVPAQVYSWHVDQRANTVVVTAHPEAAVAAAAFARSGGVDRSAVRVVSSTLAPRPHTTFRNVRGGEALYAPAGRCSIGFSVVGGYVTAGHCGTAGQYVDGHDFEAQGQIMGSSFPGDDHAWVETNVIWVPQGVVYNWGPYNANTVPVDGSAEAPVGAAVCRSGSTTGWHCGEVLAVNQTINYGGGLIVNGLTETSACSDLGDSGGSFLAGRQAQGVLSGGAGTCTTPGARSVFQPVNEILATYGLTLLTTAIPPALYHLGCVVTQGNRLAEYRCTLVYNGGAPPYTHTWEFNGGTPFQAGTTVAGVCRSPSGYSVRVTVRDSWGRSFGATTGFGCP